MADNTKNLLEQRLKQAQAQKLRGQLSSQKQEPYFTSDNAWRILDDVARSIASGATFGFADELAALGETVTSGEIPSMSDILTGEQESPYAKNLAAQRARDADISPYVQIPGEIAGGIATGAGLAGKGATLMAGAKPTVGSLATRGATEGAAYGAAHGLGHSEGTQERLKDAAIGAALGGATGALGGGLAGAIKAKPTSENVRAAAREVRDISDRAYKAAEQSGVIVKSNAVSRMVNELQQKLAKEGIDKTLHPKALAAFNRLVDAQKNNQTFGGMEILRRVVKGAASSVDPDERRIASIMLGELDDFMNKLKPADVIGKNIPSFQEARKMWSVYRKTDTVADLIERAGNRAGQFTGSGFENAIRTEFRNLVQNPKKMRGYTDAEKKFLRQVARGTPIGNLFRWIGKAAPTGIVSAGIGSGVGYSVAGPVGAAAVPAAGQAGRMAATAMTNRNVQRALDTILKPAGVGKEMTLTPKQAGILRSIIIGLTQAEKQTPDILSQPYGGS